MMSAEMVEHYYSKIQSSELQANSISVKLLGRSFVLHTANGVFSPEKIDAGTWLLIEHSTIKDGWDILDLGCGYGPVGVALAAKNPASHVLLADVNERAVMLAQKNLEKYQLRNAKALQSDGFEKIKAMFDTILLNPPQSAGRKLCNQLIAQSAEHLKAGGLMQIVARHNKGGSEFEKEMQKLFGNVKAVVKSGGYRVYVSEKN